MVLTIRRVRSRADLDEFIRVPRQLYAGMKGYAPPLDYERRQLLDPRKSPFFTHGYAAYWIASCGGRAVGRISAQIDFLAVGEDAGRTGLFGCLDTIDDGDVVAQLLQSAEAWLRRENRSIVRGPFLLSINGEPGMLIEGYQEDPVVMLAWHPRYLRQHLQDRGYAIAMPLHCFVMDAARFASGNELAAAAVLRSRAGLTVRDLRLDDLDHDMELGRRMFNNGWKDNWGFTPASETDVRALARQFKPFLSPKSGFFIEARGEPAAFVLAIPNTSEITADLGGAPSLIGWSKLLFRVWRKRYRRYRLVLIGISSRYRDSVLGAAIGSLAFAEVWQRGQDQGIEQGVAGWIAENNRQTMRAVRSFGFQYTRSYAIFEKHLHAPAGQAAHGHLQR